MITTAISPTTMESNAVLATAEMGHVVYLKLAFNL
jgi:hypothetical protein